jgi:hypothetical protein
MQPTRATLAFSRQLSAFSKNKEIRTLVRRQG